MDASNINPTYSKSAEAVLLPIFAPLAVILLIVPFIWHWRLRNIGACSLIFYINLANFFTFINVIIWPTDDFDSWWNGVGLCDIEVKLKWPYVTGLACATLCITRNLANVLDVDRVEVLETRASKRRKVYVDLAICFIVPVLQIALHYIIQVNRYYITSIGGCAPSYDNSWPTIVIMFMWPLIFCIFNCYYAVAVIYRLRKYRSNFSAILSESSSGLTAARFLRLFFMSFTLLLFYTPVTIYFFCVNVNIEWLSYSWDIIHDPDVWWVIIYLPSLGVRTFDCWVSIAMAIFVFAFFGMGGDAVETYRKWMLKAGLGRLFPSLGNPRRQKASREKKSWSSQLSLISWAKQYFDTSGKSSNTTTLGTNTDQVSIIRKPSAVIMDPITPAKFSLNNQSQNPPPHSMTAFSSTYAVQRSNGKTNVYNGTDLDLSCQRNQALKTDVITQIWSSSVSRGQGNKTADVVTSTGDGQVRINTDVDTVVQHDLGAHWGQSLE